MCHNCCHSRRSHHHLPILSRRRRHKPSVVCHITALVPTTCHSLIVELCTSAFPQPYLSTMPKPRHKVHEVDEDVLQGVWTQKRTSRGVKTVHRAVPGVRGPPSPSKRTSSPVKANPQRPPSPGPLMEDRYDFNILDPASHPFSRGKVCESHSWGEARAIQAYSRHRTTTLENFGKEVRDFWTY